MSPKRAVLMWHRDWSIMHRESWARGRSGTGATRLRSDGCGDGRVPGPQGVGTAWLGWRHGGGGTWDRCGGWEVVGAPPASRAGCRDNRGEWLLGAAVRQPPSPKTPSLMPSSTGCVGGGLSRVGAATPAWALLCGA